VLIPAHVLTIIMMMEPKFVNHVTGNVKYVPTETVVMNV